MKEPKFKVWDGYKMSEGMPIPMLAGYLLGLYPNLKNEVYLQGTGLKDMYGFEIFEGDVIDFAGLVMEIVWEDAGFVTKPQFIDLGNEGTKMFATIKGNIYKNPELKPK